MTANQKIRKTLESEIALMTPGSKISTENELSLRFGVSRMTVNKVISGMVSEGLLRRNRRWGTFVCEPPAGNLVFLLPHAQFLSEYHNNGSAGFATRLLLSGVNNAARKHNQRVKMLPVGTELNNDIDTGIIEFIKKDDLVILFSSWYEALIPALAERGIRTGTVALHQRSVDKYADKIQDWIKIYHDRHGAVDQAISDLQQAGAQKIALAAPYLHEPNHPLTTAYNEAIAKFDLPYIEPLELMSKSSLNNILKVMEYHQRHKFDALLLDPNSVITLQNALENAEFIDFMSRLKVIMLQDNSLLPYLFSPLTRVIRFPWGQAGELLVEKLISPNRNGFEFNLKASIEPVITLKWEEPNHEFSI